MSHTSKIADKTADDSSLLLLTESADQKVGELIQEFPVLCLEDIPQILSEIVEITSEKVDQETAEILIKNSNEVVAKDAVDTSTTYLTENISSIKLVHEKNSSSEKEKPVRRSTRIRRTVIHKDEVSTSRSNSKKAKNLKTIIVNSVVDQNNLSSLSSEENNQTLSEMNSSASANMLHSVTETECSSDLGEQNSDTKCQKMKKRTQKRILQNSKKEKIEKKMKAEKKKHGPKRKKADKSHSDDNTTDNVETSNVNKEIIKDKDGNVLTVPQSLLSTCAKILNNIPALDMKGSYDTTGSAKSSDEQSSELSEKVADSSVKPVKVKSRWWRSSELEGVLNASPMDTTPEPSFMVTSYQSNLSIPLIENDPRNKSQHENPADEFKKSAIEIELMCEEKYSHSHPVYEHIEENIYRFTRKKCKSKKQVRRMVCDCTLSKEEQEYGILGCKEECLNRLLMIECGSRCPIGDSCSNKRFQKKEYVKAEIIKTEKKGWGLRTLQNISVGQFLMEFVGEVLNHKEYRQRVKQYAKEKNVHSYFMALKTDEILDATNKGNLTRFINHSCDPNCETQKWTVNGELRVGVFAKQIIMAGDELTLDYKFQRYGREAQKCFCGSENCSGYIGGAKQISIDAYSGNKPSLKKRKGSDDKKQEGEDLILEEEIGKLNGNKGLRNREETLKLARLMVRADDSNTRHQLLDIIIKTEEQACLRLFLDYHGLPLLWSWMTDVVDLDLKVKILQVLRLLPISNKTMLLDSKVLNIVEKWAELECIGIGNDNLSEIVVSPPVSICSNEEASEPVTKKLKVSDFSDSESDSISSQNTTDIMVENNVTTGESGTCKPIPLDESTNDSSKENSSHAVQDSESKGPDIILKLGISSSAKELLDNWKNLKEVFRIPRLEQQKRKEDELEADHNVLKNVEIERTQEELTGNQNQIQVVISRKTLSYADNHKTFEFDNQDSVNLDGQETSRRRIAENQAEEITRNKLLLSTSQHLNKKGRRPLFTKRITEEAPQHKLKEEPSVEPVLPIIPTGVPVAGSQLPKRPALLPTPSFLDQPPLNFPPPINVPVTPLPHMDPSSQIVYPSPMMYPQTQMPFLSTAPPGMPPAPTSLPPPTPVISQPPPMLQQPPPNVGIPPCQPLNTPQPNVNLPPNPNSFLLPPNMPPSSVPSSSPFIPGPTSNVPNFPPGPNPFGSQNQPLYYMPPPTGIPTSTPTASFPENTPTQTSVSVSTQPTVPVVKEETKPKKLPKNWRTATDSEGNVYYYHSVTRQTQWDPPDKDQVEEESQDEEEDSDSEGSDSDTPTYDEPKVWTVKHSKRKSKKRKTTKAAADTSVNFPVRPEIAKKIKELFRTKMSSFIVGVLNAYRKPDCTVGRITSNDDFKYLARKLTHYTMTKELKQCKNVEDLDCNECVTHKAKDFIKKYMAKYGSQYIRKDKSSPAAED